MACKGCASCENLLCSRCSTEEIVPLQQELSKIRQEILLKKQKLEALISKIPQEKLTMLRAKKIQEQETIAIDQGK